MVSRPEFLLQRITRESWSKVRSQMARTEILQGRFSISKPMWMGVVVEADRDGRGGV